MRRLSADKLPSSLVEFGRCRTTWQLDTVGGTLTSSQSTQLLHYAPTMSRMHTRDYVAS